MKSFMGYETFVRVEPVGKGWSGDQNGDDEISFLVAQSTYELE
ncbi:hypothetical protein [Desulfitobacterium sp. PCE1]|nr:hypothetical protein [Desulfitobacterium sp. PCE1]